MLVKYCISQAFYRQQRLRLDSEECHSRRRNSFELTFSLDYGPPGALDLRLCRKTARGREDLTVFLAVFYGVPGCGGEPERRGNRTFLLVLEPVTVPPLYLNL